MSAANPATISEANPFIPMTLGAYAAKAMTYRLPSADATYANINLAGECGELLGMIAKERRDGPYEGKKSVEYKRLLKKEIGDILWHLVAIAEDNGTTLDECALLNLVKLRDRKERDVIQGSGDER